MSWKTFLAFIAGLSAVPAGILGLLTLDDIVSRRSIKRWLAENPLDGSCPLPACAGRQMCARDGVPDCEVLQSIREGSYEQVYGEV